MEPDSPTSPFEREILFVLYPGVHPLELAGPVDVFKGASAVLRERRAHAAHAGYRVRLAAAARAPIEAGAGICVVPDQAFTERSSQPIDTLFVPGGDWRPALDDRSLAEFVRAAARRARRIVATGTGSFILAQAGLLQGRRATTHWEHAGEFAQRFPGIRCEDNPVYVEDGRILTCAGATAAIDATLALVRRDFGRELAMDVARRKVMYVHREGEEAQVSVHLAAQRSANTRIRQLAQWILEDPAREYSAEILALKAAVSTRTLCRLFRRETGLTPAKFVEQVRIDIARRALGEGRLGLEAVARRSGFGNGDRLRRAFQRVLKRNPGEYAQARHAQRRAATPEAGRRMDEPDLALAA